MDSPAIEPHLETFTARDGLPLRVRIVPAEGPLRGWILWIHGGCEHGGRYGHVTDVLSAAGWSILLPDHRGHGLSGGERTDVDRYETYLDDLMDLQQQYCPQGQADVVLGHSFGGLLAVRRSKPSASRRTSAR
jgi:acylglycerol lipase